MSYEAFLTTHFERVKIRGYQATARCRFHDDKNSSFSFNMATSQWYCFAGCGHGNAITLARRLGVSPPTPSANFEPPRISGAGAPPAASSTATAGGGEPPLPKKIKETYDYVDEQGNLLYQVVRFEPKSFAQRRLVNGAWTWGVGDVRRVPYRLPQILKADEIFLVEGEKDVHKLESISLVGTTTPMGASNWSPTFVQYFRGKRVTILPDNDPPGDAYAGAASRDLLAAGIQVKVVRLPGLALKGDVSDYLCDPRNSRESLLALVRDTQELRAVHGSVQDPVAYFTGKGIEVESGEHTLPTQFRALCKKSFLDISAHLKGTDAALGIVLSEEFDRLWKECDSISTYHKFLGKLMEAHAA